MMADAGSHRVLGPDGRVLTVQQSGSLQGTPVFMLHGTPGSRSGPKPRGAVTYRTGVRLVTYDRPGYGGSTRHQGRRVADAATDVRAIADALRIDTFAIVGRSGGGPHALACAALLPDRIVRTAVLVGLAPANMPDLDWYGHMAEDNVDVYSTLDADIDALTEQIRVRAEGTVRDPESLLDGLRAQMTDADHRVVNDVAIRRQLTETYAEALRDGPYGWIDDLVALRSDWGFDPGTIAHPVLIWHGADDAFSPVDHARWLARRIPAATIHIEPGAAHFAAVEVLPTILAWLTGRDLGAASPGAVTAG